MEERKRICCNCARNIRTQTKDGIKCTCELDGSNIGYVACFTNWCNRWKKSKKFEKGETE